MPVIRRQILENFKYEVNPSKVNETLSGKQYPKKWTGGISSSSSLCAVVPQKQTNK
jgi:hypothetical protein